MNINKKNGREIYILSDATGKTCHRLVSAALTQFNTDSIVMKKISNVRKVPAIERIVKEAERINGIIVYTMVSPFLRRKLTEMGRMHGVPTIDILGPVLTRLSDLLEISPMAKPGLFKQLDDDHFERIEAVDYTIKHDDGLGGDNLDDAEIVLLGVSRSSKTPVSIYLSYRGWKVANIPVIKDIPIPEEIFSIDQRKIVALTTNPERLSLIRKERAKKMKKCSLVSYTNHSEIINEINYAEQIFRKHKWTIINTTNKSIEETSTEIMRHMYDVLKKRKQL